jgi:ribose transport system substrate-binding protein
MDMLRMNRRHAVLLAAQLGLFALVAGCGPKTGSDTATAPAAPASGAPAAGGKTLRIAVIPKGTSHEYWKSIHAGAQKAQTELKAQGTNVDILWKGPAREDDRNAQIEVVETFLSQQVDGIVLAPLDSQALARPVEEATAAKIPVVVIDSGVKTDKYVSFVATDNEKGGELGGKRLGEIVGGQKRVLMLRYMQGSASTEEREVGFLKAINAVPGIKIVSSDQYAGATVETAHNSAQNLLSRFGTQIDGIFTPNESATRGMILAMKEAGLAGKVKLVGFDSSPDLIAALKAGQVQGLVLQDPVKMGYLGVKAVVDSIQGKPVEKRIDTGVTLVTPDNLADPKIQELVNPAVVSN